MQSRIKVGLVQINNSFANQDYLPYSVGLLQALVQKSAVGQDNFEFLLPIYKRMPVELAVKNLLDAEIVLFSVYVWNLRISLEIAKELKSNRPQVVIVFGGPQVPNRQTELFLRMNPFIDLACHGEGEVILPDILENARRRDWAGIPSVSYLNQAGEFVKTPACERISNLSKIPSPYLEGMFDSLLKANPRTQWVALWETNRGCPFSCTYCDWGASTKSKVYAYELERLIEEVDWFSEYKIEFVFCCDANFGILPRDLEIVKHLAENKKMYGYPKVFSVQSTKNFAEYAYQIYKIMSDAGLNKGVSLSLQSLNEDTLRDIKRKNISIESFKQVQQKLTSLNIETFTDLILGLPSETYESFADGTSTVIKNGQHNRVQFNNLSILPGSEMADAEYQEKFRFDIVETALINIHGNLSNGAEISERQKLVVGTSTMPKADWVKARVFGWMAALLYFDKLLQVPFVLLHNLYSINFRDLIEIFCQSNEAPPILTQARSFFVEKAKHIQNGGAEFCESKQWLDIWWPADELVLIRLCTENRLKEFYQEAKGLIDSYLEKRGCSDYQAVLEQAIFLNQSLIKLPFQEEDLDITLSFNVWDVYHAALKGIAVSLKRGEFHYKIDRTTTKWSTWEDWCREVVWWGNKKGAYLYNVK